MSYRNGWTMHAESALDFEQPDLNAMREMWRGKAKAAGGLPARPDFDAHTLKPFLKHVSIVERTMHPAGRMSYRYRFYGSALAHRFGEQTGQFVELSTPPDRLKRLIAAYDAVLEAGAPMRLVTRFDIPRVSYLDGESFVAPLSNEGRKPNTLLACTLFTARAQARSA